MSFYVEILKEMHLLKLNNNKTNKYRWILKKQKNVQIIYSKDQLCQAYTQSPNPKIINQTILFY